MEPGQLYIVAWTFPPLAWQGGGGGGALQGCIVLF